MNSLKSINSNYSSTRAPKMEYKCMACGQIIENPEGPFGKRFCSEYCKEKYLRG